MAVGGDYIIKYSGLKEGVHHYDFVADDVFFEHFEYSEFDQVKIDVQVELDKKSSMMVFDFEFGGTFEVPCDRCGDPVEVGLGEEHRLIVKFGDEQLEQTDDILVLPHSEYELDVSPYIYEFILLSLPAKRVHDEDECNEEVLERLEESIADQEGEDETDPRWSALKGLNFDD